MKRTDIGEGCSNVAVEAAAVVQNVSGDLTYGFPVSKYVQ